MLALLSASPALAHGPYHELIGQANQRVRNRPDDPEAYLHRSELERAHGDHQAALADLAQAARLRPGDDRIQLLRGRALVDAGQPRMAKILLDRVLGRQPDNVPALRERARARRALNDPGGAADDAERAFARVPRPTLEDHLARASAQIAAGRRAQALRGLDEAIARLGPVVTLQQPALDLELELRRWDQALARLATLAAQSPRQETFHHRRGEILLRAGRPDEARASFRAALTAIAALPHHLRTTPAMVELAAKTRRALE